MHSLQPKSVGRSTCFALCLPFMIAISAVAHADTPTLADASSSGMTIAVTNCNDSGPGSLRNAAAIALSGDMLDLRRLTCGRITLTGGAILLPQDALSVRGPGPGRLAISGNAASSVFRHSGTGLLQVRELATEHGSNREPFSNGGCIASDGSVELTDVIVRHCLTHGEGFSGLGGGVYAAGDLALFDCAALYSFAHGSFARGGGAYAGGHLSIHRSRIFKNGAVDGGGAFALNGVTLTYSTVADNSALGSGGGIASFTIRGEMVIFRSTISGNSARISGGGLSLNSSIDKLIVDTTISGNSARRQSAAIVHGGTTFANSTIAFNHDLSLAGEACEGTVQFGAILFLDSTIAANNDCNGIPEWDLGGDAQDEEISGSNNLVMSSNTPLPPDTISSDPQLAPLAFNGGRTQTHALLSSSPAINQGNNTTGLTYDQRGLGFPRVVGIRADIGAYEALE